MHIFLLFALIALIDPSPAQAKESCPELYALGVLDPRVEPDLAFLQAQLPLMMEAGKVKGDPHLLLDFLRWYARYWRYRLDSVGFQVSFFHKLIQTPEGKAFFKYLKKIDGSKKIRPLTEQLCAFELEKLIERLIGRYVKAVSPKLSVAEKTALMRTILRDSLEYPSQDRSTIVGWQGYLNMLNSPLNEVMNTLSGVKQNIRYSAGKELTNGVNDPQSFTLPPEKFLTSHSDYARRYEGLGLKPGNTIVEIGSAFGRGALDLSLLHPDVHYVGYEIVGDRFKEALRISKSFGLDAKFFQKDVLRPDFKLEPADYYFMYDPDEFDPVPKLQAQLQAVAKSRRVILISVPPRALSREEKKWLKPYPLNKPPLTNREAGFYEVLPQRP